MLSEKEKHGMAEMLSRMSSADLFSLAQTVTSRLLVPESTADAITAIIQHTDRPIDLLKRRRVRKEFLFKYLHDKRVEGVEASADKADMITHVLQLWDSSAAAASSSSSSHAALALLGMGSNSCPHAGEEDSLPEAPAPSRNTSYSSLCSLDLHTSAISGVTPILNHLTRTISAGGNTGGAAHSSHPPSLALILNRVHASSSSLNSLNNHSEDALHGPPSSSCSGLSVANMASSAPAAATLADGIKRSESNWSFMDDQDSSDNLLQLSQPSTQVQAGLQQSSDSGCHSASSLSPAPAASAFGSVSSNASSGAMGGNDAVGGMMLSSDSSSSSMRQAAVVAPSFATATAASAQTQEMADTFVKWFYELLNAAAACETVKASNFKSEHFFPDASAFICLQSGDQSETPQIVQIENNGSEVCSALHDVVRRYGLTYNPNLCQDGVRGVMDPHGLVIVTACGTLHNAATCCGTFHQQFGLVRDPFDCNNWKIKFTNARLISRPVSEIPRLSSLPPLSVKGHYNGDDDGKGARPTTNGGAGGGAEDSSSQNSAMALC